MKPKPFLQRVESAFGKALLNMPAVLARQFTGPAIERDGFVLDPQLHLTMALSRLMGKKGVYDLTVDEARADMGADALSMEPDSPELESEHDRTVPGPAGPIPVRVYRPKHAPTPAPGLVWNHGGGWVVGSLESHDAPLRVIAAASGCVVISVNYRLAPEHPFPAGIDDTVAAFRAVVAQAAEFGVDPKRIAIGGDSAGGNLAAVVARETRHDPLPPRLQVLTYPALDATLSFPSAASFAEGFFLERRSMEWFYDHYLPAEHDRRDPRVSPVHADDLRGLPPALVISAGFDPLRDEADTYARRLRDAGVPVEHRCYGALIHGFIHMGGVVEVTLQPLLDIAASLRAALAESQHLPMS